MATQWYQKHLGDATKVLLVTNDRENMRKATEQGIFAETSMYITFKVQIVAVFYKFLMIMIAYWWNYLFMKPNVEISISVESYVKSLGQPNLLDLLVHPASEDVNMEDVEDLRPSKRKVIYPEVSVSNLFLCFLKFLIQKFGWLCVYLKGWNF